MSTAGSAALPVAAAATGLRTRLLDATDLATAERAWATIRTARGSLPVMRDWPWTATWLAHYGDVVRCRFVLVEDASGALQGAALLGRSRRRFGPVVLRDLWIGTANSPLGEEICAEFSPVLALPGREAEVARAVVAAARGMGRWDQLRADGVPEADVPSLTAGWPAERVRLQEEPAPQFLLSGLAEGADVPSGLSGGARRRARASLRALEARGPLEVEWATDADHARDVLAELAELHQARWTADGHPGLFAEGRFAAVHRELAPRLAAEGRAVLFRLRSAGHTVGCLYHLIDGDRLAFYQSGFATFEDNRLRPGLVTHLRCMAEARDRGFGTYDFLAGDVRYKRDLSNARATTCRVVLRRPRLRLRLYDAARALRLRLQGEDGAGAPE